MEATSYSVQDELRKDQGFRLDRPEMKVTEPEELLFRRQDKDLVRTELFHWMTFCEKDRMKKAQMYADRNAGLYLDPNVFPDEKTAEDARKRYLTFILLREALSGAGSDKVGFIAFNGIFKEKVKSG